jgi:hypothetical protein
MIDGTLAAFVEPSEKPISTSQNQTSELTLTSIVGGLDIAIFEKQKQSPPLAVEIAEAFAERCLGRDNALLPIDPGSKLIEDRTTEALSSLATLLGVVVGGGRIALDGQQSRDDAHAFESDAATGACDFNEPTPRRIRRQPGYSRTGPAIVCPSRSVSADRARANSR